jgi:hypothetical protein
MTRRAPSRGTPFDAGVPLLYMDGPVTDGSEDGGSEPRSVETGGTPDETPVGPVPCVQALLDATRTDGDVETHLAVLAAYDDDALVPLREDRRTALAFWLNLYNAGTQLLLDRRPELYESALRTVRFFRADAVTVAGTPLSLNDIEHGILRGSQSMVGLGYLPRLAPSAFERRYRLETVDPRIHFALNCGAASCPAIRHYEADRVDEQLDLATRSYLGSSVEYDAEAGVVRVPRVFLWYRGDFGGGSGIREFLAAYDALPAGAEPRIRHRSWDWSPEPAKFE